MITKLTRTSIYVLDQDKALDFYVNKLGFQKRMDFVNQQGFRWLTVGPAEQPEIEIVLMPSGVYGRQDEESSSQLRALLKKGVMSSGTFETTNCRALYEELKAKGVHFEGEPSEQPWGVQCSMTDGVGNWFSVLEPKAAAWQK